TGEEKDDETDDSDMDLSEDEPKRDDDATGFGSMLNETRANELMDFMSQPVYTDAQTTSAVINNDDNYQRRRKRK
ncbi:hypothetical protein Tco_0403019, partial [Tanacetum coccineum]